MHDGRKCPEDRYDTLVTSPLALANYFTFAGSLHSFVIARFVSAWRRRVHKTLTSQSKKFDKCSREKAKVCLTVSAVTAGLIDARNSEAHTGVPCYENRRISPRRYLAESRRVQGDFCCLGVLCCI